jgi:hypothetical protein
MAMMLMGHRLQGTLGFQGRYLELGDGHFALGEKFVVGKNEKGFHEMIFDDLEDDKLCA